MIHSGNDFSPPTSGRLSRHIPQRAAMNTVEVATYQLTIDDDDDLLDSSLASGASSATGYHYYDHHRGGNSGAHGNSNGSVSSVNFVGDVVYRQRLATTLGVRSAVDGALRWPATSAATAADNNPRASVSSHSHNHHFYAASSEGNNVLRFGAPKHDDRFAVPNVVDATSTAAFSRLGSTSHHRRTRILHPNPERVLDAPDLPKLNTPMLDWGSNNQLLIGLNNVLYRWDAATTTADKVTEFHPERSVRCVAWMARYGCCAATLDEGATMIISMETQKFIKGVEPPQRCRVSSITFSGPILAVGTAALGGGASSGHHHRHHHHHAHLPVPVPSSAQSAGGSVYVFDLRMKDSLIVTYAAHRSAATWVTFSSHEPYYLATGGSDGDVRIWDQRKPSESRFYFPNAHNGAVGALHWSPEDSSKLFSGGRRDGLLKLIDIHSSSYVHVAPTGSPITGIVSPKTGGGGEVATSHGVGGGHIQLRKVATFRQLGTFAAVGSDASISCMTLAPDEETVCAAQHDDTLKFWRVFDKSSSALCSEDDRAALSCMARHGRHAAAGSGGGNGVGGGGGGGGSSKRARGEHNHAGQEGSGEPHHRHHKNSVFDDSFR